MSNPNKLITDPAEANKLITKAKEVLNSPEHKDKAENALMESMSAERAIREPLPGPAMNFFNSDSLTVKTSIGEVTIRPMVAYDITIFKLIDSPFYRILMGDITNDKDGNPQLFTNEEESFALIYQFTHSCKETYNLFKKGKDIFKDEVMEKIGFIYNPADAALLVEKIMSHIFKVQLSRVQFNSPEPETQEVDGDKKKLILPAV